LLIARTLAAEELEISAHTNVYEMILFMSGFETNRLVVRDLNEDDSLAILPIYETNPGYLRLTEGSDSAYDLEKLQREFAAAGSA
jgi:hypothetical protein